MKITLDLTTVADLKAQLRILNDAMPLAIKVITQEPNGRVKRASFELADGKAYLDFHVK